MKIEKEEFINKYKSDILSMSNISGASSEECAESMYAAYSSFYVDEDGVKNIMDKLSNLPIENQISVKELEEGLMRVMKNTNK